MSGHPRRASARCRTGATVGQLVVHLTLAAGCQRPNDVDRGRRDVAGQPAPSFRPRGAMRGPDQVGMPVVAGVLADQLLQVPAAAATVGARGVLEVKALDDSIGARLLVAPGTHRSRHLGRRTVEVEVGTAVDVLAPDPDQVRRAAVGPCAVQPLHLGQVPHQPEQAQRRRRRRPLRQLIVAQACQQVAASTLRWNASQPSRMLRSSPSPGSGISPSQPHGPA